METKVIVRKDRLIREVQMDFNKAFPFLRLDFYKVNTNSRFHTAEKLDRNVALKYAGVKNEGDILLRDDMTVFELERLFRDQFSVYVQVARNSGSMWLETTMTDNWTLKQQNDHGRELSEPRKEIEDEVDLT